MANPFVYQDVFSGSNVYPSELSYAQTTLTQDKTYTWPLENVPGNNNLLPRILEVVCNTYKDISYVNIGSVTTQTVNIGDISLVVSTAITLTAGSYITASPPNTPAPVIYQVIRTVISGSQTTITVSTPFLSSIALGTQISWLQTLVPWTITLPDARQSGLGQTCLFVSKMSLALFAVAQSGASATPFIQVPPGTAWQVYLTDNSTQAGQWSNFQYGASIESYQVSGIAGPGLTFANNALATAIPVTLFNSSYAAGAEDRALTYVWTGASGQFTLPVSNLVGNNWYVNVRNQGAGVLVLSASNNVTDRINSVPSILLDPGDSVTATTDGLGNFYTLGYGRAVSSTFDYTAIDLTGLSGDYAITGTNQNRIAYNFTGALAGNITIVMPQYIQQYWVANNTTGANYTMTVKTSNPLDAGLSINRGNRAIYYVDGVRINPADNNGIQLPVGIAQGGTGATTNQAALINLGGGGTGISLFRANAPLDVIVALGGQQASLIALGLSNQGINLVQSTTTAGALTALGGATAINSILGAVNVGDVLAFSVALG